MLCSGIEWYISPSSSFRDEKVHSLQADLEEQEEMLVNGVCLCVCVCAPTTYVRKLVEVTNVVHFPSPLCFSVRVSCGAYVFPVAARWCDVMWCICVCVCVMYCNVLCVYVPCCGKG